MSQFDPKQRKLLELMWKVAEEGWSTGWMQDLEFHLWRIMQTGPEKYGALFIDNGLIRELRDLSEETQGWILYDRVEQEVAIGKSAWLEAYGKWAASRATAPISPTPPSAL